MRNLLKTFKEFKFWRVERKRLMEEHDRLVDEFEAYKKLSNYSVAKPEKVIEKIIGRGIGWYDFEELQIDKKLEYINKAKEIVENPVFLNEINCAVTDVIKEIALKSQDFDQVKDLRMTINGLELLKERLELISTSNLYDKD